MCLGLDAVVPDRSGSLEAGVDVRLRQLDDESGVDGVRSPDPRVAVGLELRADGLALRSLRVAPDRVEDAEWKEFDFDDLQKGLSAQRSNAGRIRVPTWDEVKQVLPPGFPPPKFPVRIQWSLVCMGYQPELGAAWSACTTAFREESKQDMVFEESLFWVVTRSVDCFY